jgi:hypothetical protein
MGTGRQSYARDLRRGPVRRPVLQKLRSLMRPTAIFGVILILIGVAALVYQGITYTTRETVIDIGPLHATADREKNVPLPPVLGGIIVAGGVVLLVAGLRKTA